MRLRHCTESSEELVLAGAGRPTFTPLSVRGERGGGRRQCQSHAVGPVLSRPTSFLPPKKVAVVSSDPAHHYRGQADRLHPPVSSCRVKCRRRRRRRRSWRGSRRRRALLRFPASGYITGDPTGCNSFHECEKSIDQQNKKKGCFLCMRERSCSCSLPSQAFKY